MGFVLISYALTGELDEAGLEAAITSIVSALVSGALVYYARNDEEDSPKKSKARPADRI